MLGVLRRPWQMRHRRLAPAALLAGLLLLLAAVPAAAGPGRHAVASAHPAASEAGLAILAAGGNAFDAAVAVSAALAVVEPFGSGLGGGGFFLLHRAADGLQLMVDARETAPAAARRDMYLDADGELDRDRAINGPLSGAIPGLPAGLAHLAEGYGRLPLGQSLAPAVRLAQEGFAVGSRYRRLAQFRHAALKASPPAASIFLDRGEVPAEGHVIRQPDLARVLQALGERGAAGFYQGEVARALVDGVREGGGIWSLEDLAGYRVRERAPMIIDYRGLRVVAASLPSAGGLALTQALGILGHYDLERLGPVAVAHLTAEALRRAYRDRAEYLGDPDFVSVPLERLAAPDYIAALRADLRLDRATPSDDLVHAGLSGGDNTTHFSIIDAEGNRVAATLSINYPFGSAFVAPGTGVLVNDEMDDFSARPRTPNVYGLVGDQANAIAPGKRPLSSMSPAFIEAPGQVVLLGTPGGSRIISMVLLGILGVAAGQPAEAWIAQPRYHHQYLPDEIQHEPGAFSPEQQAALEAKGHRLRDLGRDYGDMQAVVWDRIGGTLQALSDPRGEGSGQVSGPRP